MEQDEDLLDSWKSVAKFLNRSVSTVKRWEQTEGMPVHRHTHLQRCTVYAYRSELMKWKKVRCDLFDPMAPIPFRKNFRTSVT